MSPPPKLIGVGGIFIDDIVLPTGQTYMGQLGGGVNHALMGSVIWDEHPGIIGIAGQGIPTAAKNLISENFDTTGLHILPIPQMRAWQIFEEDGRRRELYRVNEIHPFTEGPTPGHIPSEYLNANAIYLMQSYEGMRQWNGAIDGMTLWEPLQQYMLPENQIAFRETLHDCQIDIVSPNLIEAQAIYGNLLPHALIEALFNDGARIVVLRMGEEGSIVAEQASGEVFYIDIAPFTEVIDQTGAGNTYCGAFLLGMMRGEGLYRAGCMGAVAASFCIEQIGVLNPVLVDKNERDRRFEHLIEKRGGSA